MRTAAEMKADPDYGAGYFDAVDGRARRMANSAYAIGYDAGARACDLLAKYGFRKRDRSFQKKVSS